ncbi:glycosyltransferase family 25 protein [Psychrobacter sp. DD43]|uniref:glycosyltransferase family 25 protein n=1 Tax=Psychrobacter sp. DD43 TaxID=2774128 RepID=UPI00191A8430|nr:glycosyltransferase family 25 protein [Psychrobacter sp. DD43]
MLHIYIVSLQQDVEKRRVISKTLEDYGLKFSFINAVYGKELSEGVLSSIRAKSVGNVVRRGFSLTPGEIGCTLSHIMAYQEILNKDLDWACILEDDAILDERFKDFINNFQTTGLNSESLYLLGGQNGFPGTHVVKSINNIKYIGGQKFTKVIRSERFIYRTCCYLISSSLAKSLIFLSKKSFILADDFDFLVKNKIINNIYLSNFVDHPLDLSESHLQKERESAALNRNLIYHQKKNFFPLRVKNSIEWRLRLLILNTYKYVEKKDTI